MIARHRFLSALAALAVVAGGGPLTSAAIADGDPASDVLINDAAFYPYAPNVVDMSLKQALNGQLKAAKAAGFELKVALIAATADLGSVAQLFTDPQKYADLLTAEISFNTKPRVLVVLPSGLGGNNLGDKAGPALSAVTVDADAGGDGLARTAMRAIGALARANGTPVATPAQASGTGRVGDKSDGGGTPIVVFVVPVLLVALLAGGAALHDRRRDDAEASEPEPAAE